MSKTVVKSRVWTFIFYPDSAPADWRDIMLQSGLKIAVSPLHDRDFTDDGKSKKPHYHVIAMWDGYIEYGLSLYRSFKIKKFTYNLRGDIINLGNKQYDIVKSYPMPGRSYKLTCSIHF